MNTVIPLPDGKSVIGESRHGRWKVGDVFVYDGHAGLVHYQFLGKDKVGGIHARRLTDQRLVVFGESRDWEFPSVKGGAL